MEEDLADWVAEQHGSISRLRAESALALTAGEYSTAIDVAKHAIELSTAMLAKLSDVPEAQAFPYRVLALAVRADLAAARAAYGDPSGAASTLWDLDTLWADAVQHTAVAVDRIDINIGSMTLAQRACPHGRASYDGHCLARPPCPATQ